MNRHDQEQLLAEVFAGSDLQEMRRASLEEGLLSLRVQKRRRRANRVALAAGLPALMAVVLLTFRFWGASRPAPASNVSSKAAAPKKQLLAAAAPIKRITDEELFALFPGRSMALIGRPGEQRLIFLGP